VESTMNVSGGTTTKTSKKPGFIGFSACVTLATSFARCCAQRHANRCGLDGRRDDLYAHLYDGSSVVGPREKAPQTGLRRQAPAIFFVMGSPRDRYRRTAWRWPLSRVVPQKNSRRRAAATVGLSTVQRLGALAA
jgi:hypothetical protein